ncbi:uncharacterized protein EDB91DRAFT_1238991 [Suillus paluster]|uniref:uncharacterized protein n=1 Tax=Suillus paluster TaxID=48578 RepID=UPI001B872D84|nr:uncharacterized protein EDB91DRAFT_1238991 [Suillus paluster]KAG1731092.1 hypothetical protein EDB91DRAFT_1238991 [Suillus paluster]
MQVTNQKSNSFQSIFGIFPQSAHTPQKIIDTLSQMGVCVSVDSINAAVISLSKKAHCSISALGQTLLASYTYDNFDVNLKSTVHTHGITLDDSHCSNNLWETSLLNLQILSDLIKYGPTCFRQFKNCLQDLQSVEMIPATKTLILASQAMDIRNSTVSRNINSVLELLKQGNIEDPAECDPLQELDVLNYVVLFHSDLGTGEHLQAALQ